MNLFTSFESTRRKLELAHFYGRINEIFETNAADDPMIVSSYNKFKETLPLANDLKIRKNKLPLTNEQKMIIRKLDKSVSVLLRYSSVRRKQQSSTSEGETSLFDFIELYFRGFSSKNSYQKTGIISKMLTDFQANATFVQTAESDGLTPVFTKMKEDFAELKSIQRNRRKSKSRLEKAKTEEVKRSLYYSLRELLTSIEMAVIANPNVNYSELINELNQEIDYFNSGSKPQARKKAEEETTTTGITGTVHAAVNDAV